MKTKRQLTQMDLCHLSQLEHAADVSERMADIQEKAGHAALARSSRHDRAVRLHAIEYYRDTPGADAGKLMIEALNYGEFRVKAGV